jgi:DNA-binding transcriptional ArsR family regulator
MRDQRYGICMTTRIDALPSDVQFETAASTLKMLADPTRLRILWALLHGEHSVNELAAHVGSPASTVSQHLAKLRLAKLVRTRRHGTQVFYVVENDHLERLTTEALFHADHATGTGHSDLGSESTMVTG